MHQWQERVRAYDQHIQRSELAELQQARRDMRTRHVKAARALLEKCSQGIKQLQGKKVSAAALARLTDVATRIERDSLGPPSAEQEFATVTIVVRERSAEDKVF